MRTPQPAREAALACCPSGTVSSVSGLTAFFLGKNGDPVLSVACPPSPGQGRLDSAMMGTFLGTAAQGWQDYGTESSIQPATTPRGLTKPLALSFRH